MSTMQLILLGAAVLVAIFFLTIIFTTWFGHGRYCPQCFEPLRDCECDATPIPCNHARGPWKVDDRGEYRVCKFCGDRQDAQS